MQSVREGGKKLIKCGKHVNIFYMIASRDQRSQFWRDIFRHMHINGGPLEYERGSFAQT